MLVGISKFIYFGIIFGLFLVGSARAEDATRSAEAGTLAAESTASSTSDLPRKKYHVRMTYLTSRAGGKDFRSFKSSGSDDSGSMNENSTMPNLNYFSARAMYTPVRGQQISFGALQSLDPASARTITGPSGRAHPLPGQIFSLRYAYFLKQELSLGLGETYVDSYKFSDPTLGLSYKHSVDAGWGHKAGLGLSIPTTEKSHNERLITRATARSGVSFTTDRFVSSASLAYSRPFNSRAGDLPSSRGDGDTTSSPSGTPGGRGGGRGGRGGSAPPGNPFGVDPTPSVLEAADLVMMEREVDRTTGSLGVSYVPGEHWKLGSGAGVTYLETARQKAIWLTSARLLGAAYTLGHVEVGSDIQMYSDIHNYQHASFPRLWNVGLHLTYFIGEQQTGI